MNIQESFISGNLSFYLFVGMARNLDLLMDLIPSWAFKAFDSSTLFIQRKLHVTHVGYCWIEAIDRIKQPPSSIFPLFLFFISYVLPCFSVH